MAELPIEAETKPVPHPGRRRAKIALVIILCWFAILWIIQVVNAQTNYLLSERYGIDPHFIDTLPYIFTAPFLHWSWSHIEGNSLPFLILGFLAAYRSIPKFIGVTVTVIVTSGMAAWLFSPTGLVTVGASGVIFGWFGYVIVRGFFNKSTLDVVVGIAVMIYYLPIFTLLLPAPHLSYEDHIGGLVGGVLCAWVLKVRTKSEVERGEDTSGSVGPTTCSPYPSSLTIDHETSSPTMEANSVAKPSRAEHIEQELQRLKAELHQERSGEGGSPA